MLHHRKGNIFLKMQKVYFYLEIFAKKTLQIKCRLVFCFPKL
jgi:hypothetical protein